ncbi:MAG: hypothetical protein K5894_02945 [Lachnospiraceae bacterium]|nr:hypothetical protein [Lachnospiraceae bacterium]
MNLVTALNKKYIPYTGIMLTSAAINNREHIDAYLLSSDLDDSDLNKIKNAVKDYDMTVYLFTADKSRFSERLPLVENYWSIEIYYKFLLTELLPENLDRALYLDGDIIVNKPLDVFYNTPFMGNDIIASTHRVENNTVKQREMLKEAFDNGYRYFNSGVMLLNLEQMRKNYNFQTYMDAVNIWNYEMEFPDQDILNWVHWKKIGYMDGDKYNFIARMGKEAGLTYEKVKEHATIVHYTEDKPWSNGDFHFDIEKLWWDYAKKSSFYDELSFSFINEIMTNNDTEKYVRELQNYNNELLKTVEKFMSMI